jgi:hypothetical protein
LCGRPALSFTFYEDQRAVRTNAISRIDRHAFVKEKIEFMQR